MFHFLQTFPRKTLFFALLPPVHLFSWQFFCCSRMNVSPLVKARATILLAHHYISTWIWKSETWVHNKRQTNCQAAQQSHQHPGYDPPALLLLLLPVYPVCYTRGWCQTKQTTVETNFGWVEQQVTQVWQVPAISHESRHQKMRMTATLHAHLHLLPCLAVCSHGWEISSPDLLSFSFNILQPSVSPILHVFIKKENIIMFERKLGNWGSRRLLAW